MDGVATTNVCLTSCWKVGNYRRPATRSVLVPENNEITNRTEHSILRSLGMGQEARTSGVCFVAKYWHFSSLHGRTTTSHHLLAVICCELYAPNRTAFFFTCITSNWPWRSMKTASASCCWYSPFSCNSGGSCEHTAHAFTYRHSQDLHGSYHAVDFKCGRGEN